MKHSHDSISSLLDLSGRVAVVTGAARGIGLSIAALLAGAGARVCLSDIDRETLQETVRGLQQAELDVTGVPADAGSPRDACHLFRTARSWAGSLDIVVANAGKMQRGSVQTTMPAAWREGLEANLTTAFVTMWAAVPAIRSSEFGRLVLMSSAAAFEPRTITGVSYAVAKAGILHLTTLLAVEMSGSSATVNAVAPGAVNTDMSREFGASALRDLAARTPLGRIAEPVDVARVVLFLVSDLGGFVNGQVIRVSGGP